MIGWLLFLPLRILRAVFAMLVWGLVIAGAVWAFGGWRF